jgi:hypothetical protein
LRPNGLLVANEATGSHNGIYVVTQVGDGSHPYILTRATDADAPAELVNATVKVSEGTVAADQEWQCTTNATITVGSTALVWQPASSLRNALVAGSNVTVTDNGDGTYTIASSAGGGGGGGAWTPAGTGQTATGVYNFAVDGAKANIDFVGLGSYSQLLVIARNLTDGTSGVRQLLVSVNNGSTFYNASGDYVQITANGVENAATAMAFHSTSTTGGRTVVANILNTTGTEKYCSMNSSAINQTLFVASASDINAIRINNSGGGNITGGTVRVFAR